MKNSIIAVKARNDRVYRKIGQPIGTPLFISEGRATCLTTAALLELGAVLAFQRGNVFITINGERIQHRELQADTVQDKPDNDKPDKDKPNGKP